MIYLDIETLDFFQDAHIKALPREEQLRAMRFGCAVTAHDDGDGLEWFTWLGAQCYDLYATIHLQLARQQQVIGWNIIDFDLPVIRHNAIRAQKLGGVASAGWTQNPLVIDLFDLIRRSTGRWYSLETIAQHNLGRGKLADGQRAAEWLRSGNPDQVARALEYCRYDVQLTIDLHAILLRGEPLRLPPRAKREELNEIHWWLDGRVERIPDAMGAISLK